MFGSRDKTSALHDRTSQPDASRGPPAKGWPRIPYLVQLYDQRIRPAMTKGEVDALLPEIFETVRLGLHKPNRQKAKAHAIA